MWVWSKLSSAEWDDAWEERFRGNPNVVLTQLKGEDSLRVDVYCQTNEEAEAIAEQFGGSVEEVPDTDWVALSAKVGPPIKIRDSLVITEETSVSGVRELRRANPKRKIVSIPPEMAFGTGDHPTTASCLRFLADEAKARRSTRWRLLDLGCGSGVLAIAANLLGAEECEALDFDPNAVRVARRNVERNRARGVTVHEADLLTWTTHRQYEVVVANLFADILEKSFGKIRKTMDRGSRLILSGVLREQWENVGRAAAEAGLEMTNVTRRGKWVAAIGEIAK